MLVSMFFQSLLWSVQVVGPNVSEPNILEPQIQIQNQNQNQNQTQSWIIELREKSILEKNLQNKKEGRTLENPTPLQNQLHQSQSEFIARMKNRIGPVMIKRKFHRALNAIVVGDLSPEQVKELESMNEVLKISQNSEVSIQMHENLSLIEAPKLWQHQILTPQISEAGARTVKTPLMGAGIRIGIIDTGIDYLHPSLGGCLGPHCKVKGGWNFVSDNANVIDDQGHGTHVAGIAAGKGFAENGTPIFGVAPEADLYAIKVLNSAGNGSWDSILAGVEWALDPNQDGDFSDRLDIINLSLGGINGEPDSSLARTIDHLVEEGVVVVIAAGNNGPTAESILHPGNSRHAITVAASNQRDQLASFSSRGPVIWRDSLGQMNTLLKPDITAPGVSICAPRAAQAIAAYSNFCEDQNHVRLSGTSMATPMVAGTAALMLQKNPELTPYQIKQALQSSAMSLLNEETKPLLHGRGFMNAYQAAFKKPASSVSLGAIKKIGDQMELELQGEFDQIEISYVAYESFDESSPNAFTALSAVLTGDEQNPAVRFFYPEGDDFILELKAKSSNLKTSKFYHYFVDQYSLCARADYQRLDRKAKADYKMTCDLHVSYPDDFHIGVFAGNFNGQFHSIHFEWSDENQRSHQSIFSSLEKNASIKNLSIKNLRLFSPSPVSALVFEMGGQVKNVSVEGLIESNTSAAAISLSLLPGALIENTKFEGRIEGHEVVGGLVAFSHGNSQILNSSVQGDLVSSEVLGGLVGQSFSSDFEISNSFASANMSNSDFLGGVVGQAENSFFMNEVVWNAQSSKVDFACGNILCEGALAANNLEMTDPLTFQNWDFENIWAMISFETEPFFLWETEF